MASNSNGSDYILHSSFSELRLKKQNDLLYKSNVDPDYFVLVEDSPSMFKFI